MTRTQETHVPVRTAVLAAAALVGAAGLTACSSSAAGGDAIALTATDSSCEAASTELPAGHHTFAITNKGSKVTEVYVYAPAGDGAFTKIVTEKENIGPGTSYDLTVSLDKGAYQLACKPGQKGDGIRQQLTVNAASGATADPAAEKAVSQYRTYVQQQADAVVPLVDRFAGAVKAGDVAKAKSLYAASRIPWEAVEPVAESFGDLDPKVDLREADLEAGQEWTGWHRIEKALWTDGDLSQMGPVADQLAADVRVLQERVATADMTVASIGNGAKELLDEVATGKITGEEEAFSHTDLVDFQANLDGARKAYDVLRPLVSETDLLDQLDVAFAAVQAELDKHRDGDTFVSYDTVTEPQRRELARVVDGLGEPLSQLAAAAV
jgi:iron uptake system component EfeO